MCFQNEPGQAHLLRMAWVQLAPWLSIRPRAGGHLGFFLVQFPPRSGKIERMGSGVQRKNLASWCLGKAGQPWLFCLQKATQSLGMGVRAGKKLPEAILIPQEGKSPG